MRARIAFGTMMFGAWGNPNVDECVTMVRDYARAQRSRGLPVLLDTADIYDRGRSEEITGVALRALDDSEGVLIATKVGNPMADADSPDFASKRGLSRRWIRESCTNSLHRLGVDVIDLYQMHRPDPSTPLHESVSAMHELVVEGKIRAWGTSTFSPAQLLEIHALCERDGLTPPSTEQPPYSIFVRGIEAPREGDVDMSVNEVCSRYGTSMLTWSSLNGGWLTGKYNQTPGADDRAVREAAHFDFNDEAMRERKRALVTRLQKVADGIGLSLSEMSTRWVISNPNVGAVLIGPRTPEQMRDLLTITPEPLPADVMTAIDDIVPPGITINPRDNG